MKKRGESRDLMRTLVGIIVENYLAPQRNKRVIPILDALGGFFVAPYFATIAAFDVDDVDYERQLTRYREETYKSPGLFKRLRAWAETVWVFWRFSWSALLNIGPTDEEWQEYLDYEIENVVSQIRIAWLHLLDIAVDDARLNGANVVISSKTMLPVNLDKCERFEEFKSAIERGRNNYRIGWIEFVEILKDARINLPKNQVLPTDIMEWLKNRGVEVESD